MRLKSSDPREAPEPIEAADDSAGRLDPLGLTDPTWLEVLSLPLPLPLRARFAPEGAGLSVGLSAGLSVGLSEGLLEGSPTGWGTGGVRAGDGLFD